MFNVYILRSRKNGKRYVGYTERNIEMRLAEHNRGQSHYTKRNGPFVLIYNEMYDTKQEALIREKFLKSGQGRKFLDGLQLI